MKQCPACKKEMKDHLIYCPFDGQSLITIKERDKMLGLTLDGKYRIEEKIGEGGMGKVYRATHIHIGHSVAVKVLNPELASDRTALERFRREARAAAYVQHPNAVAVTDFGVIQDTGLAYLVMEFLKGVELRWIMNDQKQLDYEESFLIVQQTCAALHAAHAKGIIHRDLKPDNIWIIKSEDGIPRVKVLDFGIAKLKSMSEASQLTQQGMIVGTPYYMSPEQGRSEELDARSDIYSLGIIIYEMLTGQVPFLAPSAIAVVLKHANELPRPPSELRTDIPEPLETVILRALNKQPQDRQESAIQLAQEFERALFEAGIELKSLGTSTPTSPFSATSPPFTPLRTSSLPPERRRSGENVEVPVSAAPDAPEEKGPPVSVAGKEGPTDRLLHGTPTGRPASERFRFPLPNVTDVGASPKGKLLSVVSGFVLVLALVAGIFWLTQGGEPATEAPGGITEEKDVKVIPPAPAGMLTVAGGKFIMGNQQGDENEKPVREETVQPFYIDQYEVTVGEYYRFVQSKGHRAPQDWPVTWKSGRFTPEQARLPVTNVSFNDAEAYAKSVGKRLPTEIEWEYAARGEENLLYPWGNGFNPNYANVNNKRRGPAPVDSYQTDKSPFGAFGMAGNVSEWTYSDYEGQSGKKVIRGGSFIDAYSAFRKSPEEFTRLTRRLRGAPETTYPDIGFRCVKDISSK